jgi:radical SAM protein with 4Fe4S-binding SPASM domain
MSTRRRGPSWSGKEHSVTRSLIVDTHASSCYFRTSVGGLSRKALVQITERCNLHCAHCFVSSTAQGGDMGVDAFVDQVLPRLVEARVERVTLTGGEPFVHPDILEFCGAVIDAGLPVGICTNATQTSDEQIDELVRLGDVHVNVSFDGFRPASHGRFRGDRSSFATTVATTRRFAEAGLLQGLLSTPNALTRPEEFADLCGFAVEIGAKYVLMNPLSAFGRGVKSQGRLAAPEEAMRAIQAVTQRFADQLDTVYIRFPNDDKPLGGCDAGKIFYVFVDGTVGVCPYLVFAARTPQSRYPDTDFIVGNIIDADVAVQLDGYDFHQRFTVGANPTCGSCRMSGSCGKGCPAALVSRGQLIGDVDAEQCPVVSDDRRRMLPLLAARP